MALFNHRTCHHSAVLRCTTLAPHGTPSAGFVVPQEQPLLSAVDLPNFNMSDPFKQTAPDDSAHEGGFACVVAGGCSGLHCSKGPPSGL